MQIFVFGLRSPLNKMYEYVIIVQDKMIWQINHVKLYRVDIKEGSLVLVQTPHMSPPCFFKNVII